MLAACVNLHLQLRTLKAFLDWDERGRFAKLIAPFELPFAIALRVTIPLVEHKTWSRAFSALCIVSVPAACAVFSSFPALLCMALNRPFAFSQVFCPQVSILRCSLIDVGVVVCCKLTTVVACCFSANPVRPERLERIAGAAVAAHLVAHLWARCRCAKQSVSSLSRGPCSCSCSFSFAGRIDLLSVHNQRAAKEQGRAHVLCTWTEALFYLHFGPP
jgi:hypothetical protein